ncbi:MAG: SDR family NAD(P)-dependent oxidoreductase [Acidimicrobiales bacterium]
MTFADPSAESLATLVSLAGRGVIVTGAGQGLGLAIAQRVVEAGGSVLVVDHDPERAQRAAAALDAESFVCDVTDSAQVDAMMAAACRVLPNVYGLVNNVGVFSPAVSAADMSDDVWRLIVETGLTSAFYCSRAFAGAVDPAIGGSIVMNGSIESVRGRPRLAHYTATKFGMVGLAQTLAIDFGARNIRVNVIGPGLVATESTAASAFVSDPQERAAWGAALPAGRMAVPDDVARVALFFLSDLSTFVTGTTLLVDGGERVG